MMSALGESNHEDDFVILNVDIDDCPMAEFPLTEIYRAGRLHEKY